VSYTYSARYLLNDFNSDKKTESDNFFGLAPVRYAPGFRLAILPGSDVSLENIASHFTSFNNLVGKSASRNNFLQYFPTYSIVQLYTHASDSSENKEPVIYFADSALYLSELIPGKIPITRLIVLSACETGNGNLYQGEGVFSFNRGFAALGISSCISNLWPAENISTYKITELFYKYLADGSPMDLALQRAKLEYLQKNTGEKSLPYYWASAVMVGKTDAIFHSNPYPRIIILFFIMISGIIFWKLRAKKHPISEAGG
jgi:CHAT domain-containing protein